MQSGKPVRLLEAVQGGLWAALRHLEIAVLWAKNWNYWLRDALVLQASQ